MALSLHQTLYHWLDMYGFTAFFYICFYSKLQAITLQFDNKQRDISFKCKVEMVEISK